MGDVFSLLVAWKDLFIKVFVAYPLAAALVTLIAFPAWYWLDRKVRPGETKTNFLLVLLCWSVAVPLLGAFLWILGQVWSVVSAVVPGFATVVGSLFSIYKEHPFLVLVLIVVAWIVYVCWGKWRPNILPHRFVRIVVLVISVTLIAHILSPIADYFLSVR
jgi:hypothetical protein